MEPIKIEDTEFYPKDNAKANHTEEYDIIVNPQLPTPVLRRGCNFFFAIRLNRNFDPEKDAIRVQFGFGPRPNVVKGTRVILPILPKLKHLPKPDYKWVLALNRNDGNTLTVQVYIPPNAQVGIWRCSIQTNIAGNNDNRYEHKVENDIYVLFNPWCNLDPVYMENEEERKEYILNETGKIWCGTYKQPKGKHWIYGQFDDVALPAAITLLERSGLSHSDWGSPVLVCRTISAVVNDLDDNGLLVGKWNGEYNDGVSPHSWTGSAAILDKYLQTQAKPVKYGQCWVFAGAIVTICRTLGIPCRAVTNYISAHDTDCSLTVDKYFDIFGNIIKRGPQNDSEDTCWNFHVWNDVWMTRPDLPVGYGGWQIIDSTPQEKSDKMYRCGPASIVAVKKGEVGVLYDTPFVFSEINADLIHFQEDPTSSWGFSRLSINQHHVGRKIVTKKPGPTDTTGDSDSLDITLLYKNPEGTEAERLAVYNAIKGIPRAQQFYEIPEKTNHDVTFELIDINAVPFGDDIDIVIKIHNSSQEKRTISAMLSASSILYTGASGNPIDKGQSSFSVEAGKDETLSLHLTPNKYLEKLVDHGLIKVYAIANVKETKQTWSEEDDFSLTKPDMTIEVSGVCKVDEDCAVDFSFKNPLNMDLTECSYTVQGPGINKAKAVKFRNVQPKEIVNIRENFRAKRTGKRQIVAYFNSKQIQGIGGSIEITIV